MTETGAQDKPVPELPFEEALQSLEEIATLLEQGELAPEEALQRYEHAMKLRDHLLRQLEAAEERVRIVVEGANGDVELRDFQVPQE